MAGSLDYVRKHYGLDVHRGTRVQTSYGKGRVTSGSNYVHVRLDNGPAWSRRFHPQDVKIIQKQEDG